MQKKFLATRRKKKWFPEQLNKMVEATHQANLKNLRQIKKNIG